MTPHLLLGNPNLREIHTYSFRHPVSILHLLTLMESENSMHLYAYAGISQTQQEVSYTHFVSDFTTYNTNTFTKASMKFY